MSKYPEKFTRLLRELRAEAYERELQRELLKVEQNFSEWRRGAISNGELSYRLHQYETGPSRALSKRYTDAPVEMSVAYAIVTGILKQDEISTDLLKAISGPLSFYQSLQEQNELRGPDDV